MPNVKAVKIAEALTILADTLAAHGIPDARLEAELLLAHVLGTGRTGLYMVLHDSMPSDALSYLEHLLSRRLDRYPLAYLLGYREFYGLDMLVAPGVLIPRPETELLVERARAIVQSREGPAVIVDVGTGSGAIAVALAVHEPTAYIIGTDISRQALEIAATNARRHGVEARTAFLAGDLLAPVTGPLDLVVANLPYIPDEDLDDLQEEIRLYEPRVALAGGSRGLDIVRRLLEQLPGRLAAGGALLLEIAPMQKDLLAGETAARVPGSRWSVYRDLAGDERVLEVQNG